MAGENWIDLCQNITNWAMLEPRLYSQWQLLTDQCWHPGYTVHESSLPSGAGTQAIYSSYSVYYYCRETISSHCIVLLNALKSILSSEVQLWTVAPRQHHTALIAERTTAHSSRMFNGKFVENNLIILYATNPSSNCQISISLSEELMS